MPCSAGLASLVVLSVLLAIDVHRRYIAQQDIVLTMPGANVLLEPCMVHHDEVLDLATIIDEFRKVDSSYLYSLYDCSEMCGSA